MQVEGGFSDRAPDEDPGGKTKFGITQTNWIKAVTKGAVTSPYTDVKDIVPREAIDFYKNYYFSARASMHGALMYGCLKERPALLLVFVDSAVLHGHNAAIKFFQNALRVEADGLVGPNTKKAIDGWQDDEALAGEVTARRMVELASKPHFAHNSYGWVRRCIKTLGAAIALI